MNIIGYEISIFTSLGVPGMNMAKQLANKLPRREPPRRKRSSAKISHGFGVR